MEFTRLLAISLTTLDGERRLASDIIIHPAVLVLIDAHRTKPERSAAEIGWVRERLDPEIDLILIWPRRAVNQALMFQPGTNTQMFLDTGGEFRRLVSPSGKRRAIMIAPETGTVVRISATSAIFAVGHHPSGNDDRGTDRTIDLGDVYH